MPKKSWDYHKKNIKCNSGEDPKKRGELEKTLHLLENTQIKPSECAQNVCMVKAKSESTQIEMRILETGGKVILVVKWWGTLLTCSGVLWKVELMKEEIGYLAEEISKPSPEGAA